MSTRVTFPSHSYPPCCTQLLQQMFMDCEEVSILKEFTEGESGTRVFLTKAQKQGKPAGLPVIVKLGPAHLLEEE
ncbi:MAG: hypothetical protein AAF702_26075 [Chloroflexota bacterium]